MSARPRSRSHWWLRGCWVTLRVVDDLQADFALNQPLSTFALAAIELLDRGVRDHAVDVLSVLERPLRILGRCSTPSSPVPAVKRSPDEGRGYRVRGTGRTRRGDHGLQPLADLLETAYGIYPKVTCGS